MVRTLAQQLTNEQQNAAGIDGIFEEEYSPDFIDLRADKE